MSHRIIKKLRGRSGESIAETLIALLISALALMMLAGAISTVADIISRSNAQMNEYYAADNNLVTRSSGTGTDPFSIKIEYSSSTYSYQATPYENATFAGTPVIAYDATTGSAGG